MAKSVDAFRTISEVAEWLEVPPHVLRFWESKFSQVKPVKRAGGRRYYRPADMLLLGGIKVLLHDEGMTIKGVQKLLGEQGVRHVSDRSPALDDLTGGAVSDAILEAVSETPAPAEFTSSHRPDPAYATIAATEAEDAEDAPDEEQNLHDPETAPEADIWTDAAHEPAVNAAPDSLDVSSPTGSAPERPRQDLGDMRSPIAKGLPPLPDLPEDAPDEVSAAPGPLAALAELAGPLSQGDAARLAPFLDRLRSLAGTSASAPGRRD